MIRIAFFAEILFEEYDGAARTMFQIINRIDPNRFSFCFIYGKGPERIDGHDSIRVPTLNTGLNKDYSVSLPALVKGQIKQELDAFQPHVIHIATPSFLGFFALRYAQSRNIPVISLYHTNFLSYIPYYFRKVPTLIKPVQRWMKSATSRFYNHCDVVYVPSCAMKRQLENLGVAKQKMVLWQRGIDLELFNPRKRDVAYMRELTGNENPNILFASRLVWEKNIQTLIDIYKRLQETQLAHNFIIVGDGPAGEEMKRQMPTAIFMGKLPHSELAKLYASSDIFVFPSISETYGNVVIEAMASGLPCVIADGGGSADLVRHGQTGYKCLPKSAGDYLIYIRMLLSDSTLHKFISDTGLNYAQKLNWKNLTDRYFDEVTRLGIEPSEGMVWAAC
ncbi:glycosyltransferase family 4 protein [Sphingobacterium haloxyli]|uniref:Alpha-D-mannose-alpha,1-6-phosphatidyl myo-inositol monomannoside transferase n=1 Tax=Sphingobacterium haloxyli TaxID=2100533 RepID=A0A2S9IVM6_9SPHI|nr:glycosyltransferase family 1 protein [Sphingobacterium haloxyli]PRD44575.1 alpha-D-mannose-alpha,1-6-phosphatidyl myo-inositol monomannoside transferase [Sphingobacterium haloxyli]